MIATSIEQSKKLLELGLKPETADMYWAIDVDVLVTSPYINYFSNGDKALPWVDAIPAWSLSALLELMPVYITTDELHLRLRIDKGEGDFAIWYDELGDGCVYKDADFTCSNPIDAAVEMIEWLLKNKYITKVK